MIELSDHARRRFDRRIEQAARKFEREVESARETGIGALGIDISSPLERAEAVEEATRRASLKLLGSLLFFWLDEFISQAVPIDELRQRVNWVLVFVRSEALENRWPNPPLPTPDWQRRKEQEFDDAMIKWLEARQEWREYEARIRPSFPAAAAPHDSTGGSLTPLMYFSCWRLDDLSANARRALKSGLLEIHGAHLDKRNDYVESWRRTYDLIAGEFDGVHLLSEDLLRKSIPEMVADASAGGGWPDEPLGRVEPTGIFNVRFGSQFYPPWRVDALLESLNGRISHWSGHLMLAPEAPLAPGARLKGGSRRGRPPSTEYHKKVASMVESLSDDWKDDPTRLEQLAEWMDSEGIPIDKRSKENGIETWLEKLDCEPANFIKAIEYRVKRAQK